MTLLQGFGDSSAPNAKRRKVDHEDTSDGRDAMDAEQEGEGGRDVDAVDEPEDPAIGLEEQPEDDSDVEADATDPFDVHFAQPNEETMSSMVKAVKSGDWTTKRALMQSWRATVMSPGTDSACEPPQLISSLDSLRLKQKMKETASKKIGELNAVQRAFGSVIFDYRDILHCDRTVSNSDQLRQMTCLHALNHIFK